MWIFADKNTNKVVHVSGIVHVGETLITVPRASALASALRLNSSLSEDDLLSLQVTEMKEAKRITSISIDEMVPLIIGEVFTDVQPLPPPPTLYVHVTLTGGIQSPTGTLYLKNDGVDALAVHAELRDGSEANSNAVTQLGGNDIDGMWALELVNLDTGALADTPLVQMTAGVIDVSYTTTIAPCEVELSEERLQPIGDYQLKLAQPVRFKIVRALS